MTILHDNIPGRWSTADELQFRSMQVRRTLARENDAVPRLGDGHARRSDPVSAHEAGVAIKSKEEGLYDSILGWLALRGAQGGTSLEIAEGTGLDRVTVSPRMKPMEKLELVERGSEKRAGPSGVKSTVWVASEKNLARSEENV